MNTDAQINELNAKVNDLTAKLAYYTNIFDEMNDKIYYLQMRQQQYINSHARKINRIHQTIYQICGAVFDHKTEMDYVMNYMNYMMYNNHCCTHFVDHQDESDSDAEDSDSDYEDADNKYQPNNDDDEYIQE